MSDGESIKDGALREVLEETGLRCSIIGKIGLARYKYRTKSGVRRPKVVHYFLMKQVGGHIATDGVEVDRADWFDSSEAKKLLSYKHDKELLAKLIKTIAG